MNNYEGLPINKYLVIGKYVSTYMSNNEISAKATNSTVEVICRRSDIQVDFKTIEPDMVWFGHEDKAIECLLVDRFPTLQMFLDNFDVPNIELCYIIEYGKMLFPSKGWYYISQNLDKFRKHIKITISFLEVLQNYEKELLAVRKKNIKKIDFKTSVDREVILKIFDGKYPQIGYLDNRQSIEEFVKIAEEESDLISAMMDVIYLKALYGVVCPEIFDKKEGFSPGVAFRWALMRMCTKDAPIFIRRMFIIYIKQIRNLYNRNFVSNFVKKYIEYDNRSKEEVEATNLITEG